MIEQIIEKIKTDPAMMLLAVSSPQTVEMVLETIKSEFSSYNKQLLDEIEGDLPNKTAENERDYDDLDGTFGGNLDDAYNGGFSDGLAVGLNQQREIVLSTLNKYKVTPPTINK